MKIVLPLTKSVIRCCQNCRRYTSPTACVQLYQHRHFRNTKQLTTDQIPASGTTQIRKETPVPPTSTKHQTSATQLNQIFVPPYNEELKNLFGKADNTELLPEYFKDFKGLHPQILSRLDELEYSKALPVQQETLKATLQGKDVVIKSVTGSGKTLAFLVPLLNKIAPTQIAKSPQAIIVAPTRELCAQITGVIESFIGGGRVMNMTGGNIKVRKQGRVARLEKDIIVATPGRVMQIVAMNIVKSHDLKFLVLDEADELLHDMFYRHLRWILDNSNHHKQMIVTTATVPAGVQYIIDRYMKYHVYIDVSNKVLSLPDQIRHKAVLYEGGLFDRVLKWILKTEHRTSSMVFVKYKKKCSGVAEYIRTLGYTTKYINSEMPQSMRDRVMESFKSGEIDVLVTTDVSARGVDVPRCELVVHIEPDLDVTKYIHRAGRTGRAGRPGTSLLLLKDKNEKHMRFLEELSDTVKFQYYQYGKFHQRKLVLSEPNSNKPK